MFLCSWERKGSLAGKGRNKPGDAEKLGGLIILEQLASLSHGKGAHGGLGLQSAVPSLRHGEGLDIHSFSVLLFLLLQNLREFVIFWKGCFSAGKDQEV